MKEFAFFYLKVVSASIIGTILFTLLAFLVLAVEDSSLAIRNLSLIPFLIFLTLTGVGTISVFKRGHHFYRERKNES